MNHALLVTTILIMSMSGPNPSTNAPQIELFKPVLFYEVNLLEICTDLKIDAMVTESIKNNGLIVGSCETNGKNLFIIIQSKKNIDLIMKEIAKRADKSADKIINDMKGLIIAYVSDFNRTVDEIKSNKVDREALENIQFLKETIEKMNEMTISLRADICQVGFYRPLLIGESKNDLKKESISYEILEAIAKNESHMTKIETSMDILNEYFNSLMKMLTGEGEDRDGYEKDKIYPPPQKKLRKLT